MVFSKAEEEPFAEKDEDIPETEVSETRYMGEGPAEEKKDKTEVTEDAYMGEPEERNESKHETEYKRGGHHITRRATLETHEAHEHGEHGKHEEHEEHGKHEEHDGGEDQSPEPGTPDFWPSADLDQDEDWEPPTRNKPTSAPWEGEE